MLQQRHSEAENAPRSAPVQPLQAAWNRSVKHLFHIIAGHVQTQGQGTHVWGAWETTLDQCNSLQVQSHTDGAHFWNSSTICTILSISTQSKLLVRDNASQLLTVGIHEPASLHPISPVAQSSAPPNSIISISLSDSTRDCDSLVPRSLPAYHGPAVTTVLF